MFNFRFNSAAVQRKTSVRREAITTLTPAEASASVKARPIPLPPPVTMATCSVNGFVFISSTWLSARYRQYCRRPLRERDT
jgi:hypothetical protein